ncbi:uncharacterized protein TRAVEDRAFT_70905 [Trametes versicolor FP-101664 SS1]|uniref:uncharacterized protein n=1 Tax=Trametes versicolor (strain FP-101664) TaxID=717944 RepID=UPI000462326C|nr:uncharacterized protein TRAVEDRAFT_70905 [Trametes versicolor FP-101664 SS1]EIW60557.1 hypothetical protein TRAVEDRAFT_70905 [Trametes versicolor FP-101664 SS1]
MVHLVLSTTRGNSGNRYFPHQGYLGLTPVRVEGVVRTKLDEDGKPIPARAISISIRCYQSRLTRSRNFRSTLVADLTDVLWQKPPDKDYADVAEMEFPFKLTLPKRTPGFSTANYQDYRIFWRLEAVLDHVDIPRVGSRIVRYYDLGLVRYDLPPSLSPPSNPPTSPHALLHQTSKPRAPVVRYNVSIPTLPVGPSDIIFTTLSLQPLDPSVTVRSATVSVERRIDLHNIPAAPTPLVTAGINYSAAASPSPITTFSPSSLTPSSLSLSENSSDSATTPTNPQFLRDPTASSSSSNRSFTTFDSATSLTSGSSTRPLLSPSTSGGQTSPIPIPRPQSYAMPPPSPSSSTFMPPLSPSSSASSEQLLKTFTATLVSAESTSFARDPSGIWSNTLTLQWPENRGHYRWAVGETMQSDFASVRFFVRIRVLVHGPGGTDTLELEPKELTVVPTNGADRRTAMEKWAEQKESALRSKSKSPWRRRGEEASVDGTSTSSKERGHAHGHGHGLPSPPQTPAHSIEGTSSRPPPSSAHASSSPKPRKKSSRRPHTSAGPRDKAHFAYSAPAEIGLRSDPDHDAVASRASGSSSSTSQGHSSTHVGRRFKETGLGESMLYAVEMVKGKTRAREGEKRARDSSTSQEERERRERLKSTGLQLGLERDQVRAWEEELARIELQSRRSSASMLGSWGLSRRRNGG